MSARVESGVFIKNRSREMSIFEPYRVVGCITSGVPFSVQKRGTETFVTVSVGKTFQIFNVISQPFFSYYSLKSNVYVLI
ncbi:hypothetical protein RJT34_21750 [Clitoria ternatea]|uniref:Uncharacterized protein n=1 Tax=Clitoria ternatea TaxID=43366 RepID=A0AAN9IUX1_CLITE